MHKPVPGIKTSGQVVRPPVAQLHPLTQQREDLTECLLVLVLDNRDCLGQVESAKPMSAIVTRTVFTPYSSWWQV